MPPSLSLAYELRLARVQANEALRMVLNPPPYWGGTSAEEREQYAYRCVEHWTHVKGEARMRWLQTHPMPAIN